MATETLPSQVTGGIQPDTTWLSVLQFFCKGDACEGFEKLLDEMYELAQRQPGYLWGHFGRSMVDGRYFVISEWESYEDMKAWEHEERHEAVGEGAKTFYEMGRDMQNRKFVPWYKPGAERKPWTR